MTSMKPTSTELRSYFYLYVFQGLYYYNIRFKWPWNPDKSNGKRLLGVLGSTHRAHRTASTEEAYSEGISPRILRLFHRIWTIKIKSRSWKAVNNCSNHIVSDILYKAEWDVAVLYSRSPFASWKLLREGTTGRRKPVVGV